MGRQKRRRDVAAAPLATRPAPARRRKFVRPRGALGRMYRRVHRVVRAHPVAVALGLAALHVALALLTFEPRPHTGGDNAAYVTLGRSLLEFGTYTELWDPLLTPHTKYPPVFPAILAIAMGAGLEPWVQLKFVVMALSATAVAFGFLWMRARGRPVLGLCAALVIALAPGVLREGRWLLSDVPFWTFTMIGLWAFERVRGDGDWGRFAIGAVAVLLAYFTRSAGLPLALAAFGWLAWRRHWRQLAALGLLVGVPAALWWLRGRALGPSGYVSEFWLVDPYVPALGRIGAGDMIVRILENGGRYLGTHLPVLLGGDITTPLLLVSGLTFLLALVGWVARIRQRARVAELFLLLYMGLIFIWPSMWAGERFLLPVLALLLFYAGEGLLRLVRRLAPGATLAAGTLAVATVVLLAMPGLVVAAQIGVECTRRYMDGDPYPCLGGDYWVDFFDMAPTAAEVLPDDAIVLNRKPRLFYGLGGPRGSIYPLSPDPAAFFAAADSVGARYVVLDRLDVVSQMYLVPALEQHPGAFCIMLVSRATETVLFAIESDPAFRGETPEYASLTPGFRMCGPEPWRSEAVYRRFLEP
jgi:hypothetical protein